MSKRKKAVVTGIVGLFAAIVMHMVKKSKKRNTYRAEVMEKIKPRKMNVYEKYIKRGLDVICALSAILVFFPVYVVVAILVRFKLGSPVLFTQDRPGIVSKDGKETIFKMYKFRTMTDEKDENGRLLPDDVRLTKFGSWLRSTSLDELPETFNILNGTMSVVGPRPQLVRDMVFMTPEQRRRHTAKPGLSGLAQVNGRNDISWEEKFAWDLKYIEKVSFLNDVKIIFKTVEKALLHKEGITEGDMATAMDYGDWLLKNKKISQEEYEEKQEKAEEDIVKVKKVLIVASVVSFIEWFNKENVEYLHNDLKCEVHIACNFDYTEDTDEERTKEYLSKIKNEGVILHNIHFARNPFQIENLEVYRQLKALINSECFDLIHCHTPVASIMTRLAARKSRKLGSVVMYTCHGFHFHDAAPKKNWIFFYPTEKLCSYFCDYIVTINQEDFKRAKKFHAKNVRYIPGVGVDISRFKDVHIDKSQYRESIGVPEDAVMVISVGEIIERKNHEVIIRAIGKLKNPNIYYVICGRGPLKEKLQKLARELKIENRVLFLGFRRDIPELCCAADISAFPSRIEGLGLAGIEAMATGIPLVSSNVHGILDYVIDGKTGYTCNPDDVDGFAEAINQLASDAELRISMKEDCLKAVEPFEIHNALRVMWDIYDEILK
jgi:lipopolysaccharide/colanic/teichoic acid biosynthesis glycosyltransferase/glycosyltransferase involved in cell wall biosynthesis